MVEGGSKMLGLFTILAVFSVAHLVLVVALMLSEVLFVILELFTKLACALAKLALADLILLALSALTSATLGRADHAVIVVIKLADVGKGRFFLLFRAILIHILFHDLRKSLNFSARENIVGKSRRCSGNGIERDLLKLLGIAVILVYVTLERSLTSLCISAKRLCSRKALGIELDNASLILCAFGKTIELFFLCLGIGVFLVCLPKLLTEVSYYFIVVSDLLCKTALTKTAKSRERSKHTKACSLACGDAKYSVLIGISVMVGNISVLIRVGI